MQIDPRTLINTGSPADRVKGTQNDSAAPKSNKTSSTTQGVGEDTLSLSTTHSEVQKLTSQLADVPDVRTERVKDLQQQVQRGAYKPDSRQIAEALVADHARINIKA